jgi:hypothetical protein
MTGTHSKASKATPKAASKATPKAASKAASKATSRDTSRAASEATSEAASLSPERVIRLNPNVEIVGTPILQTWSDFIFRTKRYSYNLIYSIDDGEEKSCQIITTTPVLEGTISYIEDMEIKYNRGGYEENCILRINSLIKLDDKNGKTIEYFGYASYGKETFQCSFSDLEKHKGENGYCEFKLRKVGSKETFSALIPNSVSTMQFSGVVFNCP